MLNVNDDMDELFRRAADRYPLNIDGADWEKVRQQMNDEKKGDEEVVSKGGSKRWYKSLFLVLFLIPLVWICNKTPNKTSDVVVQDERRPNSVTSKKGPIATVPFENDIKEIEKKVDETVAAIGPSSNRYALKHSNRSSESDETSISETESPGNKTEINSNKTKASTQNNYNEPKSVSKEVLSSEDKNVDVSANNIGSNEKELENKKDEGGTIKSDTFSSLNQGNLTPRETTRINEKTKQRKLYAGLIAVGDISTVKFQTVKEPGAGIGLLVGYQLSRKLSIESGVYRVKKFYFSDAKYYEHSYNSPNYKLLNVEGNCTMVEVPVNVRYNLKTKLKSNWFTTAGLSSFVMKDENYGYTYESWGQQMERYMSYNNSTFNWFAVINAGIGVEQQIGKAGSLRIEPNLKIPLKGMGAGKLPISSLGINIGFTKKLF